MQKLGSNAPEFSLPDYSGQIFSLSSSTKLLNGCLVMFICNHCPYVIHTIAGIVKIAEDFKNKGFEIFAINSNDIVSYPEDSPENMELFAKQYHLNFPYLFDQSQEVAKKYMAACTPDFFLYNAEKKLVYRGQMDNSRPGNAEPNDGHNLVRAVHAVLNREKLPEEQVPSMGCNIKWRKGNEPAYYS